MIENGSKVKLKFDIYLNTDGIRKYNPEILGYRNSYVEILGYSKDSDKYLVLGETGNKFLIYSDQIMKKFPIVKFSKGTPSREGWYLYKLNNNVTPTYCQLINVGDRLCVQTENSATDIEYMSHYYWLRIT